MVQTQPGQIQRWDHDKVQANEVANTRIDNPEY